MSVPSIGKEVASTQVEGDFGGGDLNFSDATDENGRLLQLEKLEVAARGELLLDAAEGFDFRFHGAVERGLGLAWLRDLVARR